MKEYILNLGKIDNREKRKTLYDFVMYEKNNEDLIEVLNKYPEVFSLVYRENKEDFNKLMNNLIDVGYFNTLDNRNLFVNNIKDYFVANEQNMFLINYIPRLLECSFDNNFKETLENVTRYINNTDFRGTYKEAFVSRSELYILEAMAKYNYVLDDLYSELRMALDYPEKMIEISYENDPLKTVYALLKFPYTWQTKSFLRDIDIINLIKKDKGFVMNLELYQHLSDFLSDEKVDDLLNFSFKNNPYYTLVNGLNIKEAYILKYINKDTEDAVVKILLSNNEILNRREKTSVAMTMLMNNNPGIFVKMINKDYKAGLRFLNTLKVSQLNETALNVIKTELNKHKYVVGYVDNNIYLLDTMFMDSLKNDFNTTMSSVNGVYNTPLFYKVKMDEHGDEIKNIIVDNMSRNECEGIDSICEFIKIDSSILMESIRKNPRTTISNLTKIRRPSHLGDFKEEDNEEIEKYLIESKFLLSEDDNFLLMYMNPMFLLASLKNDYNNTKEFIQERKERITNTKFTTNEYLEVKRLCKEKNDLNFFLDVCGKNVYLLIELFKENPKLGYRALDKLSNPLPLEQEGAKELIDVLTRDKDLAFKKHPNLVNLLSWYMYKEGLSNDEKEELLNKGLPLNYIDLNDIQFMRQYLNYEEMKWQENLYFDSGKYEYTREDEIKLLEFLNSEFDCVEDELAYLYTKKMTRRDLSVSQMLLLVMFAKKDQYNKGLRGYTLDLYAYGKSTTNLGVHNRDHKKIVLFNGQNGNIADLLRTIIHENNHAKQHLDIITCDVKADEDIVVYSKEELLREILMSMYQLDFYKDNYIKTLTEADADLKSIMEVANILRINPQDNSFSNGDDLALDMAYLDYGNDRLQFKKDGHRLLENKSLYLDDIFVEFINKALKNHTISKANIVRKYPVIDYEYNLVSNPIKRKTINELMINYHIGNSQDKEIIRAILKHRLDGVYQENEMDNIEELEKILIDNNINDTSLKNIIQDARINNVCNTISDGFECVEKFLVYIQGKMESIDRMPNEEFNHIINK